MYSAVQDMNGNSVIILFQEEVMTLERILLQTIKFDLQVEHPYGFLLKYAKSLRGKFMAYNRKT